MIIFKQQLLECYLHRFSLETLRARWVTRDSRNALGIEVNLYLLFSTELFPFFARIPLRGVNKRAAISRWSILEEMYRIRLLNARLDTYTNQYQFRNRHSTSATNIAWFVVINIRACFFHRFFGIIASKAKFRM